MYNQWYKGLYNQILDKVGELPQLLVYYGQLSVFSTTVRTSGDIKRKNPLEVNINIIYTILNMFMSSLKYY
jgi:hypothetical protein